MTSDVKEIGSPVGWLSGHKCSSEQWAELDWSQSYVDLGPSPMGNPGPYWHVPSKDGETVHRLYPKLLQTKWLNLVRQACDEVRNIRATVHNEAIEAAAKINDAEAEKWESYTHQDQATRLVAEMLRKIAAAIRSLKLPEGK